MSGYLCVVFVFALKSVTVTYLIQRVVDLGVMTPCDKILNTALEERAGVKNSLFH